MRLVRTGGSGAAGYSDGGGQLHPSILHILVLRCEGFLRETEIWSGQVAGSVTRSHDDELLVATETVGATSDPVSFFYDGDDLLTAAGALSLTPDPDHGLLDSTSLGSITTVQDYSDFGELSLLSASGPGGLLYQESITSRDGLGRITGRSETIGGVTTGYVYTYDPAGRLDQVFVNGPLAFDYDFDANGNPLGATVDAQDRLLARGGFSYTYTDNGELETKTETATGDVTSYAYDALGNLLQVVLPGAPATVIDYVVDGRLDSKHRDRYRADALWAVVAHTRLQVRVILTATSGVTS